MVELVNQGEEPIIKVIGVGQGGSNAVKNMMQMNIPAISYAVIDTDEEALFNSPVPMRLCIGDDGYGTGGDSELAREIAMKEQDDIKSLFGENTEMLFVTACLGKGTGTGVGPVVAKLAKDRGILTIGVVTLPNRIDGDSCRDRAAMGLLDFKASVDSLVIISSERISQLYPNLGISVAFAKADQILTSAVRGISEIITCKGYVNVDMNDVKTTLKDSGDALFGSAEAEGEDRAEQAVQDAINSPLLINNKIESAKDILLNISYSDNEPTMDELGLILETVNDETHVGSNIIYGLTHVEGLGEKLGVTIVLTGQDLKPQDLQTPAPQPVVVQPTPKHPYNVAVERAFNVQQQTPAPAPQPFANPAQQPVMAAAIPQVEAQTVQPQPTLVTPKRMASDAEISAVPPRQRSSFAPQNAYAGVAYSTFTYDISTREISDKNSYLEDRPD